MKRIVIFALLLFIGVCSACSQDTITIFYDKDWKVIDRKDEAVFYRKMFQDAKKMWIANDYFISGKIQMTGGYKNKDKDIRHGHFVYYYENGIKSSEGDFVNDKKEGKWLYWLENGMLFSEENFSKGYRDGSLKEYYANGNIRLDENWKDHFRTYVRIYHDNGNLKCSGPMSLGEKNGEWIYGNINGRTTLKMNFKNGVPDGEATIFFPGKEVKLYYIDGKCEKNFGGMIRD